ncbi:MAG: hypothetical protein WCI60_01410 [bacterium]
MEQSKKHIQSTDVEGIASPMLVVINGDTSSAKNLENTLNQDVKEGKSKRSVQVVGRVAIKKNRSQ